MATAVKNQCGSTVAVKRSAGHPRLRMHNHNISGQEALERQDLIGSTFRPGPKKIDTFGAQKPRALPSSSPLPLLRLGTWSSRTWLVPSKFKIRWDIIDEDRWDEDRKSMGICMCMWRIMQGLVCLMSTQAALHDPLPACVNTECIPYGPVYATQAHRCIHRFAPKCADE